jgi:hypothetical protein
MSSAETEPNSKLARENQSAKRCLDLERERKDSIRRPGGKSFVAAENNEDMRRAGISYRDGACEPDNRIGAS